MRDINRDKTTVTAMIAIYCRRHHSPAKGTLCESCRELAAYASQRLELCPHGLRKSSCHPLLFPAPQATDSRGDAILRTPHHLLQASRCHAPSVWPMIMQQLRCPTSRLSQDASINRLPDAERVCFNSFLKEFRLIFY